MLVDIILGEPSSKAFLKDINSQFYIGRQWMNHFLRLLIICVKNILISRLDKLKHNVLSFATAGIPVLRNATLNINFNIKDRPILISLVRHNFYFINHVAKSRCKNPYVAVFSRQRLNVKQSLSKFYKFVIHSINTHLLLLRVL